MASNPDQAAGMLQFPRDRAIEDRRNQRRGRLYNLSVDPALRHTIVRPLEAAQARRVPNQVDVLSKFSLFSRVSDIEQFDQTVDPLETMIDFLADSEFVTDAERIQLGVSIVDRALPVPDKWESEDLTYLSTIKSFTGGTANLVLGSVSSWVLLTTQIPGLKDKVHRKDITPEQAAAELETFDKEKLYPVFEMIHDTYDHESNSSAVQLVGMEDVTPISDVAKKLIETMAKNPIELFQRKS